MTERARQAVMVACGVGALLLVVLVGAYSMGSTRYAELTLSEEGTGNKCVAHMPTPPRLPVESHDYVVWTLANHCKGERRIEVKFNPDANPMDAECKLWTMVPEGGSVSLGRCQVTEDVDTGDFRNRSYDVVGGDEHARPTLEIHRPVSFPVWLIDKVGL